MVLQLSETKDWRMTDETSACVVRFIGFCGVDDSVDPNLLGLISKAYPTVEFGVLFRPDKEGEPRYATSTFVSRLSQVAQSLAKCGSTMRLAAHLCSSRVNEVLQGDDHFVKSIQRWGFQRIQINATAVNGVDTSNLANSATHIIEICNRHPGIEFIIQKNEETRPLWEGILEDTIPKKGYIPANMTMLLDESKGTGVLTKIFPSPPKEYNVGYAGGIGPDNIKEVLISVLKVARGQKIWIDMESSLRSITDSTDIFDVNKCYQCISVACDLDILSHPDYLG